MEVYGAYQLVEHLATGGMAEIFLARERSPGRPERPVVVKRLLPHLSADRDFVQMFLDEARIAARLHHPNIVQIFDLGAHDDTYYLAMEYLHGEDVRKLAKRAARLGRPVPIPLLCRIVIGACAGLDYAHNRTDDEGKPLDIVHRDVSPQNVLVTFDGQVKVVDFGIAKAANQATVTRSGVLKGKHAYMSPEQAAGMRLDRRSDVFSLGIILHELLTGRRLFKRDTELLTLAAVTECVVPPPSKRNRAVRPELDEIVLRALGARPEDRYPDARSFQEALEGWLLRTGARAGEEELAAYLRDLYAERLEREARAGRVPLEDSVAEAEEVLDEEPALPSELPPAEAPPPVPPARVSPSRFPRAAWWAAGVGLALVGAAAAVSLSRRSPGGTRVHLESLPPGATVIFDGRQLPEPTPCELAAVAPGTHSVVLTKAGHRQRRASLEVPRAEHWSAPGFELEPLPVARGAEGIWLSVRSEPADAALLIDGVSAGRTPVQRRYAPGTVLTLRLELDGFEPLQRTLQVGAQPRQQLTLALEPALKPLP